MEWLHPYRDSSIIVDRRCIFDVFRVQRTTGSLLPQIVSTKWNYEHVGWLYNFIILWEQCEHPIRCDKVTSAELATAEVWRREDVQKYDRLFQKECEAGGS